MAKHTTPAKADGGYTRKQVPTSSGTKRHSASVPKAVRMKQHNPARKGTRNFPKGSALFF